MRARLVPCLLAGVLFAGRAVASDDVDPLTAHRARFREGLERYERGDMAGAIVVWEPIYRTLGAERAYRMSFNLGRAYDVYGDALHAAEYFDAYLREVDRRRGREALPENVEEQERTARARLVDLEAGLGRVALDAPADARLQVDGGVATASRPVLYLAAGTHTLSLSLGQASATRTVSLGEGERVSLTFELAAPSAAVPAPAAPRPSTAIVRPFSAALPIAAGGAALAVAVVPAVFYAQALGTRDAFLASSDPVEQARLRADYEDARTRAYVGLAATGVVAASALLLTGIYTFGATREARPVLSVGASADARGARLQLAGRF